MHYELCIMNYRPVVAVYLCGKGYYHPAYAGLYGSEGILYLRNHTAGDDTIVNVLVERLAGY